MYPGCEECVLLFTSPIKFIVEGGGKQNAPCFTAVAAYQRAHEVLRKKKSKSRGGDSRQET